MLALLLVLHGLGDQLVDVLDPRLGLFGAFRFQFFYIAGKLQKLPEKLRDRPHFRLGPEHSDQVGKMLHLLCRSGRDPGDVRRTAGRF